MGPRKRSARFTVHGLAKTRSWPNWVDEERVIESAQKVIRRARQEKSDMPATEEGQQMRHYFSRDDIMEWGDEGERYYPYIRETMKLLLSRSHQSLGQNEKHQGPQFYLATSANAGQPEELRIKAQRVERARYQRTLTKLPTRIAGIVVSRLNGSVAERERFLEELELASGTEFDPEKRQALLKVPE